VAACRWGWLALARTPTRALHPFTLLLLAGRSASNRLTDAKV
jgi:hypothetical protein